MEELLPVWRAVGGHVTNLLIAAALGLVTIFCCIVVGLVVTGHHLEEVVTGSMQPVIPIGSLVVTESLPAGQLQAGDIMVFPDPNNTKLTIVHRIVWVSHDQSGDVLVRTKGDYNALADSWTLKRAANADADKVIEILPGAGTAAGYLQTIGFAGLVLLIAGVIVYYGIRKVRQILREDDLDEDGLGAAERLT
jgi:signal peptidase